MFYVSHSLPNLRTLRLKVRWFTHPSDQEPILPAACQKLREKCRNITYLDMCINPQRIIGRSRSWKSFVCNEWHFWVCWKSLRVLKLRLFERFSFDVLRFCSLPTNLCILNVFELQLKDLFVLERSFPELQFFSITYCSLKVFKILSIELSNLRAKYAASCMDETARIWSGFSIPAHIRVVSPNCARVKFISRRWTLCVWFAKYRSQGSVSDEHVN